LQQNAAKRYLCIIDILFRKKERRRRMFDKELDDVRAAERRAEEIVQKAGADAKEQVAASRRQAAERISEAEARAGTVYDTLIREGTEEAQKNYETSMKKTEVECAAVAEAADRNAEEAIRLIKERIVNRKCQS
jgi:vacuolar-type H+-ATPase subunit H